MSERPRWTPAEKRIAAVIIIMTLVLAGIGFVVTRLPPEATTPFAPKIDHVVFVLMENRAYDNFFAGYCLVISAYCNDTGNGIPAGTVEPQLNVSSGGQVVPYNLTVQDFVNHEKLPHIYNATIASIDGGKMDWFYSAEDSGLAPFGHYNGSTLPVYWDMAQEYALGDALDRKSVV